VRSRHRHDAGNSPGNESRTPPGASSRHRHDAGDPAGNESRSPGAGSHHLHGAGEPPRHESRTPGARSRPPRGPRNRSSPRRWSGSRRPRPSGAESRFPHGAGNPLGHENRNPRRPGAGNSPRNESRTPPGASSRRPHGAGNLPGNESRTPPGVRSRRPHGAGNLPGNESRTPGGAGSRRRGEPHGVHRPCPRGAGNAVPPRGGIPSLFPRDEEGRPASGRWNPRGVRSRSCPGRCRGRHGAIRPRGVGALGRRVVPAGPCQTNRQSPYGAGRCPFLVRWIWAPRRRGGPSRSVPAGPWGGRDVGGGAPRRTGRCRARRAVAVPRSCSYGMSWGGVLRYGRTRRGPSSRGFRQRSYRGPACGRRRVSGSRPTNRVRRPAGRGTLRCPDAGAGLPRRRRRACRFPRSSGSRRGRSGQQTGGGTPLPPFGYVE
jgi:hypothetical protein